MSRFIPVDRDTSYLLPPSVDEWLPENHLARFVVEVIDPLDLSKLTRQYAGRGSAAHHPSVLLGLLVYGYATGVFSSRKPVLSLVEGIEAQLRSEVQTLLAKAEAADGERLADGVDLPAEVARREERLKALAQARAKIKERSDARFEQEQQVYEEKKARREAQRQAGHKPRGKEPKPPEAGPREKDPINLTDEESRIMPTASGFEQAYNAQAAVDTDTMLVMATLVTQQPNDKQQVEPMLEALPESLGQVEELLAPTTAI